MRSSVPSFTSDALAGVLASAGENWRPKYEVLAQDSGAAPKLRARGAFHLLPHSPGRWTRALEGKCPMLASLTWHMDKKKRAQSPNSLLPDSPKCSQSLTDSSPVPTEQKFPRALESLIYHSNGDRIVSDPCPSLV